MSHLPSKDQVWPSNERVGFLIDYWTAKLGSHRRWPEGQGLQAELMGLIYADTIAAMESLDRLRTALRGVQSCSTCSACRGAATLALGGSAPEPEVRRCKHGTEIDERHGCRLCLREELGVVDQPLGECSGQPPPVAHSVWCNAPFIPGAACTCGMDGKPQVDVRAVDCPACGKPMSEHKGELKPGAVLWCP